MRRSLSFAALVLPIALSAQAPNGPDAPDMVLLYDPVGMEFTFVLDDSGLSGNYSNSFNPFTQLGYDMGETYCFVAVAMAYNHYHHSATCDTLQQVLLSRVSSSGALQAHCMYLAEVGMTEHR